jgi:hypothetical protein
MAGDAVDDEEAEIDEIAVLAQKELDKTDV